MTDVPRRCLQCSFFKRQHIHEKCTVCRELGFSEIHLCDLNRKAGKPARFHCQRFRPDLRLVGGKSVSRHPVLSVIRDRKEYFRDVLKPMRGSSCGSKGGCLSCLNDRHDSSRPMNKFHVVWLTTDRKPVFSQSSSYIRFFHEALLTCGTLINGKAVLIWLAPDHLHLYLELAEGDSVMDVAEDIQLLVQDALIAEFDHLQSMGTETSLFNREFFVEAID